MKLYICAVFFKKIIITDSTDDEIDAENILLSYEYYGNQVVAEHPEWFTEPFNYEILSEKEVHDSDKEVFMTKLILVRV